MSMDVFVFFRSRSISKYIVHYIDKLLVLRVSVTGLYSSNDKYLNKVDLFQMH